MGATESKFASQQPPRLDPVVALQEAEVALQRGDELDVAPTGPQVDADLVDVDSPPLTPRRRRRTSVCPVREPRAPLAAKLIAWYQPHNISRSSKDSSPNSLEEQISERVVEVGMVVHRVRGPNQQPVSRRRPAFVCGAPDGQRSHLCAGQPDPLGEEGDMDAPLVLATAASTRAVDDDLPVTHGQRQLRPSS